MSEHEGGSHKGIGSTPLTRREVLKGALALGAGAALAPAIAACGGGGTSSSSSSSASASAGPKKGGALKIGVVGGSAKEHLDGALATTEPEICNCFQLYDALMGWDENYQMVQLLAETTEANADASVWTVKLRSGVTFHDGKPVTADDVVFSYTRIIDPKNPLMGASQLASVKASGIKKIDASTVEFHLTAPNVIFDEALALYGNIIVPTTFDPKAPVGTGPFKLTSFSPGQQIVYAANKDYWGGAPHVDTLTVIEFADPAARVNALLGGTVDAISQLPSAQAAAVTGGGQKVLDAHTGAWQPFTMRIDQKPFNDVRVRQAFRLIIDRKQMIEQAFAGYGAEGNDVYAPFDPGTVLAALPQRAQDLAQAKSLLKAAGYDNNLTVTLTTSDAVGSAAVAAAQVFAEQAKAAGVTINVNKVDSSVFYGDQYLKWTFAQDFWYTRNYLAQANQGTMPTAPYNECHWKNDKWLALVQEAFKTADKTKRNELVAAAQKIEYDEGGYIVWAFNDQIDAYSSKLGGVVPDKSGVPLSSFHFNKFYFA